ncbi:MAG: PQQ-like beta-propeller repeat protein [Treponema sp.]|jgi:hypothetical protein|nr:PQQ-like beta-propeller repeat protein [Treponema sp.]
MKRQKKVVLTVTGGIVFSVLYILFAGKPLESGFQFNPQWTISIAESELHEGQPPISEPGRLLPFKLGQTMGYFTPEGNLCNATVFPYKAMISSHYYASFPENAENTLFFTPAGEAAGVIMGSGFPYFEDDRVYLFHPGGAAFSRYGGKDGAILWTHEDYAPVLAFASSTRGSAAGFADGSIIVHTPEGKQTTKIIPGGSAYPVILGVAISASGKRVASISGLQKQRFVLTEIENDANKVLYHEYFETDSNEQGLVRFSSNDRMVYFTQPEKLTVLDCASYTTAAIPMKGRVLSIIESRANNLVFVLTKESAVYSVYILENYNMPAGSFSFTAAHGFIRTFENALYIGKDDSISKLEISRN